MNDVATRDQCGDPRRPAASSLPLCWWCSGSPVTSPRVMTFRSLYRLERGGLLS
jgi:hypothetical protein